MNGVTHLCKIQGLLFCERELLEFMLQLVGGPEQSEAVSMQ